MTVEAWLLAATTAIAVVAVVVATVAVRSVRDLRRSVESVSQERQTPFSGESDRMNAEILVPAVEIGHALELAPKVVEGRVIVPPTQAQVVRTALGRPGVRLSVLAHGLARALRPENRDRISALMRREYRHRRRQRLQAARQAIRTAHPTSAPTTDRMHESLLEPQPLSLTDRMIRS